MQEKSMEMTMCRIEFAIGYQMQLSQEAICTLPLSFFLFFSFFFFTQNQEGFAVSADTYRSTADVLMYWDGAASTPRSPCEGLILERRFVNCILTGWSFSAGNVDTSATGGAAVHKRGAVTVTVCDCQCHNYLYKQLATWLLHTSVK